MVIRGIVGKLLIMFNYTAYWQQRYLSGGNSGTGSTGALRAFKSATVNAIIEKYSVSSILDLGCGDGGQIFDIAVKSYVGIDVSEAAVELCRKRHGNKVGWSFCTASQLDKGVTADMTMSLDVIYHISDPKDYQDYLETLWRKAARLITIYSSISANESCTPHIVHRPCIDDLLASCKGVFKVAETIEPPENCPKTSAVFTVLDRQAQHPSALGSKPESK